LPGSAGRIAVLDKNRFEKQAHKTYQAVIDALLRQEVKAALMTVAIGPGGAKYAI
jgi:hypothetical protein